MIVSNATPLIYLAKAGKLHLLKVFGEVIIPEEVKIEVVDRGKELEKADAYVIEKAIEEGWIKVLRAEFVDMSLKLHPGEVAVLSLAKRLGIEDVLVDEKPARFAAKLLGLRPRGTVFVLLSALKEGVLDFDEFLETLHVMLKHGFRLREDVIVEAIKEAKNIVSLR